LRWARDETDLDLRNSRFRSAVADLAAPMHGIAKDELEGEDIRQHRRTRRLARSGVTALAVLVVVSLVFGVFAVVQRNHAQHATSEAVVQRDRAEHELLVAESQALLGSNRQLAALLAIEAENRKPGADTRDALMNAVLAEPLLQRTLAATTPVGDMAALAGHRVAIVNRNRGTTRNRNVLQVWDWQTGRRQTWHDAPLGDDTTGPQNISATADGLLLAVTFRDGSIQLFSGRTLAPQGPPFPSGLGKYPNSGPVRISPNGESLAVWDAEPVTPTPYGGRSVSTFSRVDNHWVPDPPLAGIRTRVNTAAFSADGSTIATASATPAGSDIVVSDVASGRSLFSFAAVQTSGIALDWTHRRVVVALASAGASDAVSYDLNTSAPTPHAIDVGSRASGGFAVVGYDAAATQLGINTGNGLGVFDAATLARVANLPALPTTVGRFLFVDATHVLTEPNGLSPVSLWDLSGTSVLATRTAAAFKTGVFPFNATPAAGRFAGTSQLGNDRSITILGRGYRPLGAPIAIDQHLDGLPADVSNTLRGLPAVFCPDGRGGRFATLSPATGDIVVRDATPPFRILDQAPHVAAGLADAIQCAWSPDGRQIAIGTYPRTGQAASVAVYDTAAKRLRFVKSLPGEVAVGSLFYSPDSKTLWVGGLNLHTRNGVYRVTNLDHAPRFTVTFPGAHAISADAKGRRLVVAYTTSVRGFDARTREPLTRATTVAGTQLFLVYSSPDGHEAVVEGPQGWRLIDLDAQQPTGPWIPNGSTGPAIIGGDGHTVYTTALNGGGEIWDISTPSLRKAACGLAGRNLTEQEWQKYLSRTGPRRASCAQYPLN
jgi:WD40 repeat protein